MVELFQFKNNFVPLEGAQVKLSLFTAHHLTDRYLGWLNDPAVVKFSNQRFLQHTRESSSSYLDSFLHTDNIFLAICLKESGQYVGTMSVYFSSAHQVADIGVMVGERSCWGKGIGGDAWRTVLDWLMDVARVRKVTGGTLRCNAGMVNIMINAGMKPDGVRAGQELVDGKPEDVMYFAKFNSLPKPK